MGNTGEEQNGFLRGFLEKDCWGSLIFLLFVVGIGEAVSYNIADFEVPLWGRRRARAV